MARSTLSLLFLFGLVCLASAQTNSTITEVDDGADELPAANTTDTTANATTEAECPLTEASLAGVDLTNATSACLGEGFLLLLWLRGGAAVLPPCCSTLDWLSTAYRCCMPHTLKICS